MKILGDFKRGYWGGGGGIDGWEEYKCNQEKYAGGFTNTSNT